MKHERALDGIRGIAILAVILFHYTFLSSGWAGVQLFFVLSGFLITSILVSESHHPLGQYLKRFYWRRTLRIFPLYFGYLALLGTCYGLIRQPAVLAGSYKYLLTYTLNFQRLDPAFPNNVYFGHCWSLAVEEQFYFVWPLLIYLLRPKGRQVLILVLLASCPAIRALTSEWVLRFSTDPFYVGQSVYSFTPGQLDAFASGAAVVVFRDKLAAIKPWITFCLVTALLIAAGQGASLLAQGKIAMDTTFGYPLDMVTAGRQVWGYSLINLWSASLIVLALDKNCKVGNWLSNPVLTYLGRISYGMYLFHLVVQATMGSIAGPRHSFVNLLVFGLYLGALTGICSLSFRYYESWFLSFKDRKRPGPAIVPINDLDSNRFTKAAAGLQ
jgi:peptidoglycan/LPS O-acetylase OafA/YrhL